MVLIKRTEEVSDYAKIVSDETRCIAAIISTINTKESPFLEITYVLRNMFLRNYFYL